MVYLRFHIYGMEIFRYKLSPMGKRKTFVSPSISLPTETDDSRIRSWSWKEHSLVRLVRQYFCRGNLMSATSSTIIEDIDSMRKIGLASLAFFYFDFRDDKKKDRWNILSSLLHQLCVQSDLYCNILSNLYLKHRRGIQRPNDDALAECLIEMLKLPGQAPVYIVLDALDECPNTASMEPPREKVLKLVVDLVGADCPNLHICVTSRPESDITPVLDPLCRHSVSIHGESGQRKDIDAYITSFVDTEPLMQHWKAEDKQLVIDVLTKKADGM